MAIRDQRRKADTSPTKEVVVNSLTKDATTEACLFDLVDNAIDGARENLERTSVVEKETGLPVSYKGFRIGIQLDASSVVVSDNAGGISASDIQTRVLRFGARSKKPHGIGFYGVGLNRALFKLGQSILIETDDGTNASEIRLDVRKYLAAKSWKNDFTVRPAGKSRGTKITRRTGKRLRSRERPKHERPARYRSARRREQFLDARADVRRHSGHHVPLPFLRVSETILIAKPCDHFIGYEDRAAGLVTLYCFCPRCGVKLDGALHDTLRKAEMDKAAANGFEVNNLLRQ